MTMTTECRPAVREAPATSESGAVVVAVDGSRGSLAAVEWAAREAVTPGRRLRLVNVVGWPYTGGGFDAEGAATLSAELLAEAAARARSVCGEVEVVTESIWGRLGPLLIEVARQEHMVVLGHRGGTGFAGMVLGSRAVAVATHANGPVVVVPEPPLGSWRPSRPVVVVGVDGTRLSTAAVTYAFGHAARHGYELEAVAAESRGRAPDEHVADVLQEVSTAFPAVLWRERHLSGSPAEALTATAATDTALLVVGCRSRWDRSSPLLDSVSRGAIFLARCPVAVV